MTYDEFVVLLKGYQGELWLHTPPKTPRAVGWSEVTRPVTEEELKTILDTARSFGMPMTLEGVGYFADIGIRIYALEPFPGVGNDWLFFLSQKHLPFEWAHVPSKGLVNDRVWELFTEYTNTPQNLELLRVCGLPLPRKKTDYDY